VKPYFVAREAKQNAIDYAKTRLARRYGEIRVFKAAGELEQTIAFDERAARQRVLPTADECGAKPRASVQPLLSCFMRDAVEALDLTLQRQFRAAPKSTALARDC
jgi:hypothetical protein